MLMRISLNVLSSFQFLCNSFLDFMLEQSMPENPQINNTVSFHEKDVKKMGMFNLA